jgi:hypothetical protein
MKYIRRSGGWWTCLTDAQVATVKTIRMRHAHGGRKHDSGSHGWTVYHEPTTLPATYLELRHHMLEGRVARWVIDTDGSVSATNEFGDRKDLVPTELCA